MKSQVVKRAYRCTACGEEGHSSRKCDSAYREEIALQDAPQGWTARKEVVRG